jgi:hypothetical protein
MSQLISTDHFDQLFATDPAFRKYVSRYKPRRKGAESRCCPPLVALELLEATYFNNGEPPPRSGGGRKPAQHVLNFQGWTSLDGLDLGSPDWEINATLHVPEKLLCLIKTQLDHGTISGEYYDALVEAVATFGDECWYGQFFHNDGGQSYFEHQYCIVRMEDSAPTFLAIANGDLDAALSPPTGTGWSDRYSTGARLADPAKAQLRWDVTGHFRQQMPKWATV